MARALAQLWPSGRGTLRNTLGKYGSKSHNRILSLRGQFAGTEYGTVCLQCQGWTDAQIALGYTQLILSLSIPLGIALRVNELLVHAKEMTQLLLALKVEFRIGQDVQIDAFLSHELQYGTVVEVHISCLAGAARQQDKCLRYARTEVQTRCR